ncbi:MAG TPA: adenylate kinase [Tenuifilaceae bacterium]|nr:adenylate kinase [Tenuifilaceae bacterium]HPE19454.1 adenylate kinase [Tenuifilaceae bacterium]HPJ47036.1 adenylate kinase [Tenuifilaceae bacterium]HPQ35543.1 adenylate kinase [Tenuifilaceae bacterium]HRX69270.1 adenylate kinase [Tenuifilaceae bacterium]
MLNIVLFGPPGAGKGTQSQKLIEKYNLMHLSTGDILRNAIERETPRGIEARKYMDRGELVPDELVIGIIGRRLEEYRDQTNGFIFDGFPRTNNQAKELDVMLKREGMAITILLALEVEYNELVERILKRGRVGGRTDDQDENIIKNRINVYNETTRSVMEYYKGLSKYEGVNGMGSVEEIFHRICNALERIAL